MIEKMTLEQFQQVRGQLSDLEEQLKQVFDTEKQLKIINQYRSIQNRLLSYDLSDIPFEAWEDFWISSTKTHAVDFSKSRANIDFNLVKYYGNSNFRGCNVRNLEKLGSRLNIKDFDEQTIRENSSLFLSDSFSEDFKDKYYSNAITISDLVTLSNQQLAEIKQKDSIQHVDYKDNLLSETLGIDKVIQFYNYSQQEYEEVNKIINSANITNILRNFTFHPIESKDMPKFEEFLEQIKSVEITELKTKCFDYARKLITNTDERFNQENYPESFVRENANLFLLDANIPAEVKQRYFNKKLNIQDLLDYKEVFQNIPIDYFIDGNRHNLFKNTGEDTCIFFRENYGLGKFQELLQRHPDVFAHIQQKDEFEQFNRGLEVGKNLESTFAESVKEYFLRYGKPKQFRTVNEGQIIFNVPDWLSSMNFQFVDELNTIDDLLKYNDSLFVLNDGQRYVLDTLNIENIRKFEQETGFFSHKSDEQSKDLEMFKALSSYFSMGIPYSLKKSGVDFKNGSLSYEEFLPQLAKCLDHMKKNNLFDYFSDYDFIEGDFRNNHPEIFMDINAKKELKKAFYKNEITPKFLFEHKEYIPYLIDKNLSNTIKADIKLDVFDSEDSQDNITLKSVSFIDEYVSRYGPEKLLQLVSKYGDVLSDITITGLNDEIENEQAIEKSLKNSICNKIIEEKIKYHYLSNISDFTSEYPELFLSDDAPEELKNKFYDREITPKFLFEHKEYIPYLIDKNLSSAIRADIKLSVPGLVDNQGNITPKSVSFIDEYVSRYGSEKLLQLVSKYGDVLSDITITSLNDEIENEQAIEKSLRKAIYNKIIKKGIKYSNLSNVSDFTSEYPELFLSQNVPQEIRNKFYNKEFTLDDFHKNFKLMEMLKNTNIICGFPGELSFMIPLFSDLENSKIANYNRLKVISSYSKIQDKYFKQEFVEYLKKYGNNLDMDKVDCIPEVFSRLEYSNSIEMSSFKQNLAVQLLDSDNPIGNLETMEKIFLKNNLPLCGKMFLCFQVLYPDLSNSMHFRFNNTSRMAPGLKDESIPEVGFHASNAEKRLIIIFNDLLRIAYNSNERSLIEYLDNIELGNKIYLDLKSNNFDISKLNDNDKETLEIFVNHLETLYQNTERGKDELGLSKLSLEDKLKLLSKEFKETEKYDLKDRIVRSFCYTAGIKSFDELKEITLKSLENQKKRTDKFIKELNENNGVFKIHEDDFVRCIGNLDSLASSLGTGNFSKEHLGVFTGKSNSDTTPLDVDLTLVTKTDNLYEAIAGTPTGFGFGNIYLIFRKDNSNISISRDKNGNLTGTTYDPSKIEVFGTNVANSGYETHWGARTGISLADVDCILYKEKREIDKSKPYDENGNVNYSDGYRGENDENSDLPAVKFEIARNGYYIPVIDFSGKLIFTKDEFNSLREKMQGLSYYNENHYTLSDELITPQTEQIASSLTEDAVNDTNEKRNKINSIIKEVLDELGLSIKYKLDGDLSDNSVEFIDTGSTARNTNVPYDGDFDFFMRLDANIMRKPEVLSKFKEKLTEKMKQHKMKSCISTNNGDLRFKKVQIDDETIVDIDISFGVKTNKVRYSSDECLKDRLNTIKTLYPDKYKYVVANIILAKRVLKDSEINAYKPRRTDANQGGLGGVGVENWILQNGGSFVQSCRSFLSAAMDENGCLVPFDKFKEKYEIWDFGENHFAARNDEYLHDNFIENNMNEVGYQKMASALTKYLSTVKKQDINQTELEEMLREDNHFNMSNSTETKSIEII